MAQLLRHKQHVISPNHSISRSRSQDVQRLPVLYEAAAATIVQAVLQHFSPCLLIISALYVTIVATGKLDRGASLNSEKIWGTGESTMHLWGYMREAGCRWIEQMRHVTCALRVATAYKHSGTLSCPTATYRRVSSAFLSMTFHLIYDCITRQIIATECKFLPLRRACLTCRIMTVSVHQLLRLSSPFVFVLFPNCILLPSRLP